MAQNTEYTKIKESTLSAFFSKLKSAFWNKADVMNVSLADIAVTGQLADATQDSTHRTVTDTDIVNWNNAVPITTTINGKALSSDITLSAADVTAISTVTVTANRSSSCSITGSSNAGKAQTIIYINGSSSDVIITVPTTYKTPDGAAVELTCHVGGYCEVSYLNIEGTIYVRGL